MLTDFRRLFRNSSDVFSFMNTDHCGLFGIRILGVHENDDYLFDPSLPSVGLLLPQGGLPYPARVVPAEDPLPGAHPGLQQGPAGRGSGWPAEARGHAPSFLDPVSTPSQARRRGEVPTAVRCALRCACSARVISQPKMIRRCDVDSISTNSSIRDVESTAICPPNRRISVDSMSKRQFLLSI